MPATRRSSCNRWPMRSTIMWSGSIMRCRRTSASWPIPPTNCGPRSPSSRRSSILRNAALTSNQIGAFGSAQVLALATADLAAIQTADISALKTAVISALRSTQLGALTTAEIAALSTNQIAVLSTSALSTGLSTDQIGAFTSDQFGALTTVQIAALSTVDFAAITTLDISVLKTAQVAALTTAEMASFNTDQIGALSTNAVTTLSSRQIASLSTDALDALSTNDIVALKTSTLVVLTTQQYAALTTNQLRAMTTTQIHAMTTSQLHALSSDQEQSLTTQQIQALPSLTPIVLDLNGDGITTLGLSAGVQFDLAANGSKNSTGWIGGGDGFLVEDLNGNGKIDDGSEMFGSGTTLANDTKAANGYQALAQLDTNGDGVINSADKDFSKLEVWVDSNADGVTEAGELHTLSSLGITQLNLDVAKGSTGSNGNVVGLTSTYQTADGATHAAGDVWLQQGAAATPAASTPAPATTATGMRGNVSGLVQAMAAFDGSTAAAGGAAPKLDLSGALNATKSTSVAQMADVLKRFDANGKLLSGSTTAAPTDNTLRLNALQHQGGNGFLAAPK